MNAQQLIESGYAVVSRQYGILSRIDREDWKDYCIEKGLPVNADWYRRCVSKDNITVSQLLMKGIPNSGHCGYEFREKHNEFTAPDRIGVKGDKHGNES